MGENTNLCRQCGELRSMHRIGHWCGAFIGPVDSRMVEAEARGFAAGIEAAAKVADAEERAAHALLQRGKGEWLTASYIMDETWNAWIGREIASRSIAREIRALTPKREGT